jgi:cell division control protein 6
MRFQWNIFVGVPLNTRDLTRIISKVEKENSIFANKAYLDILSIPTKIIGREKQAEDLVRYLLGYDQGSVVPFVSVYGRSGSGKSTIVRFVCENLKEISYCFVNLRKSKTIFGAANLILAELGHPNIKSAQGINLVIETIGSTIESILKKENKKLFVLVLDESDTLFYDKRGKPSDFIYKLIILEENLRQKGHLLSIISIANNPFSEYELDDRVRSRIGSSEVFFDPYSHSDVKKILEELTLKALSKKVNDDVLEYCAQLSSAEHGDARRAIDLLRVAAELASTNNENISKSHVDTANDKLQKDRVGNILSTASYHFKAVCTSLARISYLTKKEWHSTTSIFNQYLKIVDKDTKPVTYRRVSEILREIENTGLTVSQTSSKGRYGYGSQYKLDISPETVGEICFPKFWMSVARAKIEHDAAEKQSKYSPFGKSSLVNNLRKTLEMTNQSQWERYVGSD